jgi:hypothetical protein
VSQILVFRLTWDKPVDMMTAGYEKTSPYDKDDGSGSDSSTSSYVSSSSDGHYRRKSRGSSSGASAADKAIESALAKQAATIPTIPKSVMAKVKNSAPRCFANLEVLLQSKNTARELWFTALVQLLPENLISIRELQQQHQQKWQLGPGPAFTLHRVEYRSNPMLHFPRNPGALFFPEKLAPLKLGRRCAKLNFQH